MFSKIKRILGFRTDESLHTKEPTIGKVLRIKTSKFPTKYMCSGDTFTGTYKVDDEVIAQESFEVNRTMYINTMSFLEFDDALEMKHGFMLAVGESND